MYLTLLMGLLNLNIQEVYLLDCFIQPHESLAFKKWGPQCEMPLVLITLKKCEAKFIIVGDFLKLSKEITVWQVVRYFIYIYIHTWLKITYIHANTYMYIHAYIYIIYLLYICMETHMWVKPCMSMCILWTQKLDRLDTNCYAVLFQDFLVMILKILYNLTKLQLP